MTSSQIPTSFAAARAHPKVETFRRRSILKSLGIAGGLVLAAPVMSRQRFGL